MPTEGRCETMNSTLTTQPLDEVRKSEKTVFGGSLAEGIASGAAIVLTLVALSGIAPEMLLSVAVIVMGAAFLLEGGAISIRFSKLLAETSTSRFDEAELGVGVTSEFLGGVAGIILGILSLLRIAPMVLVPAAVIVYASTLMMSSGMTMRLNALELEGAGETTRFRKIAHEAMTAAAGVEFLLGLAAAILGIIAVVGVYGTVLSLVALLAIGVSGFVTGTAVTARMVSLMRRHA
jgi:hypothetical protein